MAGHLQPGSYPPAGLVYAGCLQDGWELVGGQDSQGLILAELKSNKA